MISFVSGMPYSENASSVLDRSRAATPASDSFASVLANTRAGGQTASIANLQFAMQASKSVANAQTTGLAAKSSAKTGQAAAKPLIYDLRQCGYFSLADENGRITYKGVTFQCDRQKNRLTLGDVSNEKNCIKVGLARGGSLVFNKGSKGDLLKAMQMFDKEDQDRILSAIYKDKIARNTYNQDKQKQTDSVLGMAPDDDEYTKDSLSGEPEGYAKNDMQTAAEGSIQF